MQRNDVIDIRTYVAELVAGEDAEGPGDTEELPTGSELLRGQYVLTGFLNSGGFGITYRATNSLLRDVVIKECFLWDTCQRVGGVVMAKSPSHQARFDAVKAQFIAEAHGLAALEHPNIVKVHQVFEENRTAYIAMDHVDGPDLLTIIEERPDLFEPDEVEDIARGILGAISHVHARGMLHRDVAPDNILIDRQTRVPYLIDFGAAFHGANARSAPQSALKVVKDGYSPYEFYVSGIEHSKRSDLYSIAATLYHLVSGDLPPDAEARTKAVDAGEPDPLAPLAGRFEGFQPGFLEAIDTGLNLKPEDRMATAGAWLQQIPGPDDMVEEEDPATATKPARQGWFLAWIASLGLCLGATGVALYTLSNARPALSPQVLATATELLPTADEVAAPAAPLLEMPVSSSEAPVLPPASERDGVSDRIVERISLSAPTGGTGRPPLLNVGTSILPITPFAGIASPSEESTVDPLATLQDLADTTHGGSAPTSVEVQSADAVDATQDAPFVAGGLVDMPELPSIGRLAGIMQLSAPRSLSDVQVGSAAVTFTEAPTAAVSVKATPSTAPVEPFSHWDVDMPFSTDVAQVRNATVATITAVDSSADLAVSGAWIGENVMIYAVNDEALPEGASLSGLLLDAMQIDPDGFTRATVRYREAGEDGRIERGLLAVPVVRRIGLSDGTLLTAQMQDATWVVTVTEAGPDTTLIAGDALMQEVTTGADIDSHEALDRALGALTTAGLDEAKFNVLRGGALVTARLPLAPGG